MSNIKNKINVILYDKINYAKLYQFATTYLVSIRDFLSSSVLYIIDIDRVFITDVLMLKMCAKHVFQINMSTYVYSNYLHVNISISV